MTKRPEVRIYTTNPIESFNSILRKITRTKSSFPTDDSLFKILYLAVMDTSEEWKRPVREWGTIMNQLMIYFKDRIEACI